MRTSSMISKMTVTFIWLSIVLMVGISAGARSGRGFYGDTDYCKLLLYWCSADYQIYVYRVLDTARVQNGTHRLSVPLDVGSRGYNGCTVWAYCHRHARHYCYRRWHSSCQKSESCQFQFNGNWCWRGQGIKSYCKSYALVNLILPIHLPLDWQLMTGQLPSGIPFLCLTNWNCTLARFWWPLCPTSGNNYCQYYSFTLWVP